MLNEEPTENDGLEDELEVDKGLWYARLPFC
jgi:hypothetical protein